MESKEYDVAVVGSGPGGYVAAIKASQSGKKVALIEKDEIGGTCLNVGCIPTKTLIAGAHLVEKFKQAEEFGIHTGSLAIDFKKMKERKDSVVLKIRTSLKALIESNGIHILKGAAHFVSPKELKVEGETNLLVKASKIILAAGSEPFEVPAFPCDHKFILNSTSVLSLVELPKKLVIIGGGYIGCEFASLYATLGVEVTIVEALPSILATQGKSLSDAVAFAFKKKGIEILTGVSVEGVEVKGTEVSVKLKGGKNVTCDKVLVSIGRSSVSKGLKLENAGVKIGSKGFIEVNDKMETNVSGIYAIGDVTGKNMLAHVASHQGVVAARNALGDVSHMHYDAVPAVIFTTPEIATVGMSLEQALESGYDAACGKFPFQALGKSIASMETDGFAQVVTDKKTGQILGAQVMGHDAASLIGEMSLAISNELTVECVSETIHAHPTLSEAWQEAAFLAQGTPLHFPPAKRKS